jgi:hypothetical protein
MFCWLVTACFFPLSRIQIDYCDHLKKKKNRVPCVSLGICGFRCWSRHWVCIHGLFSYFSGITCKDGMSQENIKCSQGVNTSEYSQCSCFSGMLMITKNISINKIFPLFFVLLSLILSYYLMYILWTYCYILFSMGYLSSGNGPYNVLMPEKWHLCKYCKEQNVFLNLIEYSLYELS